MREILFKARRLDNGDWVEGDLVRHPSAIQIGDDYSTWYIHVPPTDPDDSGGVFNVDPSTVCQYTGLTDKNGKKIFEGDKLYDPHENSIYTVDWNGDNATFQMAHDWHRRSLETAYYCEVIGSIHDGEEQVAADG